METRHAHPELASEVIDLQRFIEMLAEASNCPRDALGSPDGKR
ncbi:MAG TPA: hypothetical protein VFY67_03385 [Pyrinomonadaceae bacterium]|nr:hypothetical protein [Pyrinomonadaceae bacterium]